MLDDLDSYPVQVTITRNLLRRLAGSPRPCISLHSQNQARRIRDPLWTTGTFDPSFMREIDVFMKLCPHPAVCIFYGSTNGTLHNLLTLAHSGHAHSQWNGTLKSKIVLDFAAGMRHLNSYLTVHRYLSPNNILFDE
jgi:serine/threonine protein kinase